MFDTNADLRVLPQSAIMSAKKYHDKDKLLHVYVGLDVDEVGDMFDAVSHAAAFEQVATTIGVEAARSAQQRKLNWQKNMWGQCSKYIVDIHVKQIE